MNEATLKLIDACCEARERPDFAPMSSLTHCNEAVHYIASKLGFGGFVGMLANNMIDLMNRDPHFQPIPMAEAQTFANLGMLVIAGEKAMPHGHVCVVRPGNMAMSGNWKVLVPKIINVGQRNFIDKIISWAFRSEPKFWVWKP